LYALAERSRTVNELANDLGIMPTTRHGTSSCCVNAGWFLQHGWRPQEYRLNDDRLIQALDLLRTVLRDQLSRRAELVGV
jgi:hypothetical protein